MRRRPADPGQHGGPSAAVMSLDRVLILWRVPDGDRAAGLYTDRDHGDQLEPRPVGADRGGPVHLFPVDAGPDRRPRPRWPARRCAPPRGRPRCWPAAPPWRTWSARTFLGALMPRYAEGLPALRPLLPGTLLLGLAWPARQMLIAVGPPLHAWPSATLVGLGRHRSWPASIGADRWWDRRGRLGDDDRLRRGRLASPASLACVPRPGLVRPGGPHQIQADRGPWSDSPPGRPSPPHTSRSPSLAAMARVRRPLPDPGRLAPTVALVLGPEARLGRIDPGPAGGAAGTLKL